jgi:uncharacterized protein YcfJ
MKKLILIGTLCLSSLAMAEVRVQNTNKMPGVNTPVAKVIESIPVYQDEKVSNKDCTQNNNEGIGALLGAVIGGAIGAQHNAVYAITGTIIGAGIGSDIASPSKGARQACASQNRSYSKIIGYDVKYVYDNLIYIQRLDYDPGVGSFLKTSIAVTR